MAVQATLAIDQEIASLRTQLSDRKKALRDTQQTLDKLTQAPHFRAQHIQELEGLLKKKQDALEIVKEQCMEYNGTDLQVVFEREARQSEQAIQEFEKLIRDTQQKHARQSEAEYTERRTTQQAEQTILHSMTNLKNRLRELETQQDAKKREEGEQAYKDCIELYKSALKAKEDSIESQREVVEMLSDWPELQERFLDEYSIDEDAEPTDGVKRITQAALMYLEALIEHSEELQGVMIFDGTPIAETLALTDQEVLAYGYQGGIDLLQRKRAALLRFV